MKKMPQKRGPLSVFTAPEPGETVEINPPSLQWVAEPGVSHYHVEVRSEETGKVAADGVTAYHYFRFSGPLPPGRYRWNVWGGGMELGEQVFVIPENARLFRVPTAADLLDALPETHPRHVHFPADLAFLREKYAMELEIIRRNVQLALRTPLMEIPNYYGRAARADYRSMLDEIRFFLDRNAVACALAYLFLNDDAAGRYAHDAVLRVCEWNPVGPASVRGIGGDEMGLSICRTLPSILDWTWDLYTPEELDWACATLAKHGEEIYRRLIDDDFLGRPGNSHAGRLPGYLGEIALVLADRLPRTTAETYLNYALEVYGSIFPHYGGRDGGWAEGVFYGSSYTQWFQPFFFAVERLSGFSFFDKPFYRKVSQFFLHFAPPGQESYPFGDGNWPTEKEWPGFQAQNPFNVYADRFGPETAREFARRALEKTDVFQLHLLNVVRPEPPRPEPEAAGKAENAYISRDAGLISMRRCVADPEHDIALLARCSRYGTPSHQHADQGNFAVLAGGKALLVPSGSFGYQYGENHHFGWTVQTMAHNCVLIDGVGQAKDSAEAVGTILEFTGDRAVFDLAAAYPMLTSYLRTLAFDRKSGEMTVTDEISADRPVTAEFRLHSYSEPVESGGGAVVVERLPGRVEIRLSSSAGEGTYTFEDCYRYAGNSFSPGERELPVRQYHMNWRFPAVERLSIVANLKVSLPGIAPQ